MLTELQTRKLLKLFCMYDGDRDGVLVYQDFEKVADKLAAVKNLGTRSPKFFLLKERFMKVWQSLLQKADAHGDEKVNLDEWQTYYDDVLEDEQKYTKEVQSLMELIFDVFDTNGDGKMSQQEWTELFQVYNIHPAYAPYAFDKIDSDHDGFLNKNEMLELIKDFFCGSNPNSAANLMFGPY